MTACAFTAQKILQRHVVDLPRDFKNPPNGRITPVKAYPVRPAKKYKHKIKVYNRLFRLRKLKAR